MDIDVKRLVLQLVSKKEYQEKYYRYEALVKEELVFLLCGISADAFVERGSHFEIEAGARINPIHQNIYNLSTVEYRELYGAALSNTYQLMPPRLFGEVDLEHMDFTLEGRFMEGSMDELYKRKWFIREGCNGFRLTNTLWYGGAIAAFYPGVLDRLRGIFRSDLYLTFPGHHVARIHPIFSASPGEIKYALDAYREEALEKDMLSPYVYRYDGKGLRVIC